MIEQLGPRQELPHYEIEIIYEMGKVNSIVRIDGELLAKNLLDLGYSKRMLVPIIIRSDSPPHKLASFQRLRGNVYFHEGSLVNAVKLAYARINEEIGYPMNVNIPGEYKGMLSRLTMDDVIYTLFKGDHNRRLHYIRSAKAGSLSTSMNPEQQRMRAHSFMRERLIDNVHGYTSRAFAHEYEHSRHILKNAVLTMPVFVATGILLNHIGHTIGLTPEATEVLTLLGGGVITIIGMKQWMEYQSRKAGTEHMENLLNSISINRELLEQKCFPHSG